MNSNNAVEEVRRKQNRLVEDDGMSKQLTISVASYNVENFLANALEPLAALNDSRVEVIVVNDGSLDGTLKIARDYANACPNIKVIDKPNGGYGSTINASLKEASGRYFKLMDADDWYDPDALSGLLDVLEETDVDLVLSPFVRQFELDGHSELVQLTKLGNDKRELNVSDLPKDTLLWMHSMTYKTALLQAMDVGITEKCFYTDVEFAMLPLIGAKRVLIDDHPVYQYRIGREGQSVSASGIIKHFKDHERVLEKLLTFFNEDRLSSCQNRELIESRIVHDIALHYVYLYVLDDRNKLKSELDHFNQLLSAYQSYADRAASYGTLARLGRKNNSILNMIAHARARSLYPS